MKLRKYTFAKRLTTALEVLNTHSTSNVASSAGSNTKSLSKCLYGEGIMGIIHTQGFFILCTVRRNEPGYEAKIYMGEAKIYMGAP